MEATVDCKYGIITGVDVYPSNEKESLLVLRHLERQIQKTTLANIISKTPPVLSKQAFGAEFLEAVAILLFIEDMNVLGVIPIGI